MIRVTKQRVLAERQMRDAGLQWRGDGKEGDEEMIRVTKRRMLSSNGGGMKDAGMKRWER